VSAQEFNISHLPDQVQGQVARLVTPSQGVRQITGPLTEGLGPTSSPGSLPASRVACHCSPVGFDRQQRRTQISSRSCEEQVRKSISDLSCETNRIPVSRNPTPCIVVIVPGSSAITYRTHFRHNITVILIMRSNTGLIIT
jgi:hypothetical protein